MEKLSDRIYVLQINTKPVENQYECYEVSDTSIKIKKTTNKDKYKMKKVVACSCVRRIVILKKRS